MPNLSFMDVWTGVGILILGAGLGGLLTWLSFHGRIQRIKEEVLITYQRHRDAAHEAPEDGPSLPSQQISP